MIVDTSALIAILTQEPGWEDLRAALVDESALIPAPVMVEYMLVASGERLGLADNALALLEECEAIGMDVLEFTREHAKLAAQAIAVHGKGLGSGGTLNLLDLMVYAVARERGETLLCTGKVFAATDITLHVASRPF